MKRILTIAAMMCVFSIYAEDTHEAHTEPFKFVIAYDVQTEPYAEAYRFASAQAVQPEAKAATYENIKAEVWSIFAWMRR